MPTDDAIVTSDTVGATEGAGGDSGDTYSITEAVARANAPKSSTKTYKSSKSATTVSTRGRTRTAPSRHGKAAAAQDHIVSISNDEARV